MGWEPEVRGKTEASTTRSLVRAGFALAAVGLFIALAGCQSSPSPSPSPTALGQPALAFDKTKVDLGKVPRDQQGTQTFLAINRGSRPLQVSVAQVEVEQGCAALEAASGAMQVAPGRAALLAIKLGRHKQLGPHHVWVNLSTSDPARPLARLELRFTVEEDSPSPPGPRLLVDKEMIDIGTVPVDWPLYEQFTLRNGGDAPLTLEKNPKLRVLEGC